MKQKPVILSFLFLVFLLAVFGIPVGAQLIIAGVAYEKMKDKGCGQFDTATGFQFKNVAQSAMDRSALHVAFKKEMEKTYPQAKISIQTGREASGFAIKARKKIFSWPCESLVYYFGFGKNMYEARERAEKQLATFCKNCPVIDRIQM